MTSTVVYEGDLRTTCTHLRSSSEIETDAPVDNKGKGERFSPTDLLATSLATCMLTIMGIKARNIGVELKGLKIDVEKLMKPEPRRVSGINLTFHIPDELKSLDEENKNLLKYAAETCPVRYSIHPDIEVIMNWNWD